MKITAQINLSFDEQCNVALSENELDNFTFKELTLRFAEELRKMKPLYNKKESYHESTEYQIQAIVLSMDTFKEILYHLEEWLPREKFEVIKNRFNNTI